MGFSTSGSAAILLLAFLIAAGAFIPTAMSTTERVGEAVDGKQTRALDQMNTNINITDVNYNSSDDTLTIKINNTGPKTLAVDETDILVDGVMQAGYNTSVDGQSSVKYWPSGTTLTVTISNVASEPNRVKVVSETAVAETSTNIQ